MLDFNLLKPKSYIDCLYFIVFPRKSQQSIGQQSTFSSGFWLVKRNRDTQRYTKKEMKPCFVGDCAYGMPMAD
jgi:hypothetical protein